METLGKRIVLHRKRLGLTQEQLAEKLGVTAQAVSRWENDQSCPDITMLPRLCDLFGISTDELLGREQKQKVHEAEIIDRSGHAGRAAAHGSKTSLWIAAYLIAVGTVYLLAAILHWDLGLWTVLWTMALTIFGLKGIWPQFSFFRMGCVLFGVYFLAIHVADLAFHISSQVLAALVFLFFGLGILVDFIRKKKKSNYYMDDRTSGSGNHQEKNSSELNYDANNGSFSFSGSFGESRQRVDLAVMRSGNVKTCFGEFTLDLSGVDHMSENAVLTTSCSFGQLNILVPRRFRVNAVHDTACAHFEIQGEPFPTASEYFTADIHCSFGETVIRYI